MSGHPEDHAPTADAVQGNPTLAPRESDYPWMVQVSQPGCVLSFFYETEETARETYQRIANAAEAAESFRNDAPRSINIEDAFGAGSIRLGIGNFQGVRLFNHEAHARWSERKTAAVLVARAEAAKAIGEHP